PLTPYSSLISVTCTPGTVCNQYVRYQSTDNVDNVQSVQSSLVRIDKQPPTTTDDGPSAWQNADTNVNLTPVDGSGSGVSTTNYCIMPGAANVITTVAGTGTQGAAVDGVAPLSAQFNWLGGWGNAGRADFDSTGHMIIADGGNNVVRAWAATSGTYYGKAMTAGNIYDIASISGEPADVNFDTAGNIYVAAPYSHLIRKITTGGTVTTFAGTGSSTYNGDDIAATTANLSYPINVAVDTNGHVYFSELNDNYRLRVVAGTTGTFFGQSMTAGNIYTLMGNGTSGSSPDGTLGSSALFGYAASDLEIDSFGNVIFDDGSAKVRVLAAATGTYYGVSMTANYIYTIAGGGGSVTNGIPATSLSFSTVWGIGMDLDTSSNLYLTDYNSRVWFIPYASGSYWGQNMTANYAYIIAGNGTQGTSGDGGPATSAAIDRPSGTALDASGFLYISGGPGFRIRKVAAPCNPTTSGTLANVTCAPSSVCKSSVCYKSTDVAGNTEAALCSDPVQIDKELPNSAIASPANGSQLSALTSINGSASDASGSGLSLVRITIQRVADLYYWEDVGYTWVATQSWLNATGTSSWSYNSSGVSWTSGNNYTISARATDTAANDQSPPANSNFLFDNSPPSQPNPSFLTITMNPPGTPDQLTGASGAVEPNAYVKVYSDGLLANLIGGPQPADGSGAFGAFSIGNNEGDGSDLVYVTATDAAGNPSSPTSMANDKTPPGVPTLSSPADTSNINTSTPSLLWSSSGANTRDVEIASDALFGSIEQNPTGLGLDQYTASPALSPGPHYWRVRALDAAGNPSTFTTGWSFTVDTTPPNAGTVTPANTATVTHVDGLFDITTTFTDANGIASCEDCVATDGLCDTEWSAATWNTGTCTSTGQVCTDGQSLTINMRATDSAGNVGTATPVTRACDALPPTTADDAPPSWQANNVSVALTESDAGSGIASTNYCVDTSDTCSPLTPYSSL
ncbi:MAG: hypothetical protein HYY13_07050, partial [Nitrospirae bacterium]|nr:hypothetical protein [Nitrospirota bacterium]